MIQWASIQKPLQHSFVFVICKENRPSAKENGAGVRNEQAVVWVGTDA